MIVTLIMYDINLNNYKFNKRSHNAELTNCKIHKLISSL